MFHQRNSQYDMPTKRKTDPLASVLEILGERLKSGFASGMFSAEHKGDILVRAAYLRGISDAIDIVKAEANKSVIDDKSL